MTGGCGFLGTCLVAHLLDKDKEADIKVIDNLYLKGEAGSGLGAGV
ncbi:MAG: SDR family oxidoreductase [Thermodesulfovibrionales bacterium]|nr:SDR family oxidoreductase [Thermodesulfovibrionales bacterium]